VARLESPLPESLPVGKGTAVFCMGACFHQSAEIRDLALLVDGRPHRPAAWGMPRPDVHHQVRRFRSGFWATVPVPARDRPGSVELGVRARLAGGAEERAPLGRIAVVEPEPSPRLARGAGDIVAICMGTFDPDPRLFRRQVASLQAQTDPRWVCIISDDGSRSERLAAMEEAIAGDSRFCLSRGERRTGFYGNFERALLQAPAEADLLALCDQDDIWHPDKLAVLRAALGDAQLVYSDQRLVDDDGRVLRPTLWNGRRNNHTDLASLLVANTITGAATLFRREVAELALPFPDAPGVQFHDHWIGLVALATGDVRYVDRPLYDYVQHGAAVFGEVGEDRGPRASLRGAYFLGYLGREVLAQTLLVRCAQRLTPAKRRALRLFVAAARSPLAFAWLAARPLRALAGRNETLGSEHELVSGIAWRWLVALLAFRARAPGRRTLQVGFPDEGAFRQRRVERWRVPGRAGRTLRW
jgi:glycosyltransferase involved in cell wall biosynthesis